MQSVNMHSFARSALSKGFVLYCCASSTWQIYFPIFQWLKAWVVAVVGSDMTINKGTNAFNARSSKIKNKQTTNNLIVYSGKAQRRKSEKSIGKFMFNDTKKPAKATTVLHCRCKRLPQELYENENLFHFLA